MSKQNPSSSADDFDSSDPVASSEPVLRAGAAAQPNFWYANCDSHDHPSASTWSGAKRTSRREAVKDAADHNRQFSHHAAVMGPVN